MLKKLIRAGCRVDGLHWEPDGTITFVATNVSGPWNDDDKDKVRTVLGVVK